jgi:hypothetical protein
MWLSPDDQDRICCALGADMTFDYTLSAIGTMVGRPEWQARAGAMAAISAIGEGQS